VAYTAEQIQVLEGREHVRRRPSMYIGSTTTTGLHHLVYEVVDNAVDEALAGYATRIIVTLFADGSVQVDDNGRGIPVDIHKKEGLSALELVLTRLNAGGKFGGGGYKVSSGLHGVGVSAVNFLSEQLQVWVHRSGKVYHQEFARGVPKASIKVVGKTDRPGTIVRFWPDPQIFPDTKFDREVIQHRLREMAYLNKRLEIALADESLGFTNTFYFEGGIVSFVRALNRDKAVVNAIPFYVDREVEGTQVEVALQYNDTFVENVLAFANTIHTIEGGSHLTGFARPSPTSSTGTRGRRASSRNPTRT
jgi:DNA gyrase subunit B